MDEDEKSGCCQSFVLSVPLTSLSIASGATVVAPQLISDFERVHYWNGISMDPPELLYHSDLESNPFPVPHPGTTRWSKLPVKTAEGVFGTPLNAVWHIVAPMMVALFKKRGIKYSALKTARFSTRDEDGKKTLGPIEHKVEGAVVEWYEGSVEKLSVPALMRVADETNPTHYVRRPFTAEADAQGTVSFFFHENKTKNGEPSARILAVCNKHVLRQDTTVDYQFMGSGAPRQYVRVCGFPLVTGNVAEAVRLAEEIVRLEAKEKSEDEEQAEEDEEALQIKKGQLDKVNRDNRRLQAFFKEVNMQWNDIARRNIGFVDWAPSISIDVDDRHYTRDIGTVELDPQKFKDYFQGNVVQLGNKFTSHKLNTMFWPNNTNPSGIKFPFNGLLRIQGVVKRELLATPDCYDDNGDPVYIVGKDGNTTDFTMGRYFGLEAYLCDKFGKESIEVAVYNYSKTSGNFSAKGDSGSLIFTGDGRMLAILHSGMPKGLSSHVSYGTPAWWAVEQLQGHYPNADLNRTTF
ncbi:hypothetical protein EV363DRAFT_1402708 [Boletus edulis]|nr:hypothetical protein EV363DRAFT_1402708 [Boletus edulis]